jgi:hypothetical protein
MPILLGSIRDLNLLINFSTVWPLTDFGLQSDNSRAVNFNDQFLPGLKGQTNA